ncbi:MAG: hypothetical protein M0T79_09770 [Actinomycetota bacterium]|nr:hypothetical protein [Actinomycetota bacterium]
MNRPPWSVAVSTALITLSLLTTTVAALDLAHLGNVRDVPAVLPPALFLAVLASFVAASRLLVALGRTIHPSEKPEKELPQ